MAEMLYRTGKKQHTLDGVECDYQVFEDEEVETALADGWVTSPSEVGEVVADKPASRRKGAVDGDQA